MAGLLLHPSRGLPSSHLPSAVPEQSPLDVELSGSRCRAGSNVVCWEGARPFVSDAVTRQGDSALQDPGLPASGSIRICPAHVGAGARAAQPPTSLSHGGQVR